MYIKGIDDMLLKDNIERELAKIGYLVDLDEVEKVLNNDLMYIKEYEEDTAEKELLIHEDRIEYIVDLKYIGNYKGILSTFFQHILEENKEYIKARKRTNKYFRNMIRELKDNIRKKK